MGSDRGRTARRAVAGSALTLASLAVVAVPASATVAAQTAGAGPSLTVSQTSGLDGSGQLVDVAGAGFDASEGRGLYVAFCAVPQPGLAPSPCGGAPGSTGGGASWVSGGDYGTTNGAVPFGPGGSFSVQVLVSPKIGDLDCTNVQCAVVARSDHLRIADRSQDVVVPVSFAGTDVTKLPLATEATGATDDTADAQV